MIHAGSGETGENTLRVERAVAVVLRVGVVASIVVIAAGMLLSAMHHPKSLWSPTEFNRLVVPGAAFPHTISGVVQGVTAMQGRAVMMAGLLILLVLPAVRVILTGLIFVLQRDTTFVLITLGVLLLLMLSLVLGHVG